MTLEQKRAEVLRKIEADREAIKTKAEELMLDKQLELLNNPAMVRIKAITEAKRMTTDKLNNIELSCKTIVDTTPMNTRDGEVREFKASTPMYGFNNQVTKLLGIFAGIRYSASEHKSTMLRVALPEVPEDLLETTLDSLGANAYWNEKHAILVEEKAYSYQDFVDCLALVEMNLGLNLDLASITEAKVKSIFENQRLKAEALEVAHIKTQKVAGSKLTVKID